MNLHPHLMDFQNPKRIAFRNVKISAVPPTSNVLLQSFHACKNVSLVEFLSTATATEQNK